MENIPKTQIEREKPIAIPYRPYSKDLYAKRSGFECPRCKYHCTLMNANYCPGCGQKIKLAFVSDGAWSELLEDALSIDKSLHDAILIRSGSPGEEGEIIGVYLTEFRKQFKQRDQVPGQIRQQDQI